MIDVQGFAQAPPAAQMFGGAGREYRWKYGTKRETFAQGQREGAQARGEQPVRALQPARSRVEEVMASDEVFDPLTRYQCCPPTCGAAAAILCSDDFAKKHGITSPVWIAGAGDDDRLRVELREEHDQDGRLRHDRERREEGLRAGGPRARRTCRSCELHDCFTANEILTYEGLGPLQARARPRSSSGTSRTPTAARSSPTRRAGCSRRATRSARPALAQCTELVWQLRGRPTSARCRTRRSRSSTTSASAAPASSRCTGRTERERGEPPSREAAKRTRWV